MRQPGGEWDGLSTHRENMNKGPEEGDSMMSGKQTSVCYGLSVKTKEQRGMRKVQKNAESIYHGRTYD